MNKELKKVVRAFVESDADAQRAYTALFDRMSMDEADAEIGRVILGCMWEAGQGLPDRMGKALKAIEKGASAAELFPDKPKRANKKAKAKRKPAKS